MLMCSNPSGLKLAACVVYLGAALLCIPNLSHAAGNPAPKLFYPANPNAAAAGSRLPQDAGATRYVRINFGLLRSGRLQIDTGDNRELRLVRNRIIKHSNGGEVWEGEVDGHPGSSVVLGRYRNALSGVIRVGGDLYKIVSLGNGVHAIVKVNAAEPHPEVPPVPDEGSGTDEGAGGSTAVNDDGTVIDVLVVYTPDARDANGGQSGINALIAAAVGETNQAYFSSNINTQLNLVHSALVDYTESTFSNDLSALRYVDGEMDEALTWRNQYGADQVVLIRAGSFSYCGIAYLNNGDLANDAGRAFSVVYHSCATGYYSFGHELAHNQGSHHDYANAAGAPLYPYSYGWQDPGESFRTVMAYDCPGGCTRQQFFSNPDLTFENTGLPTGDTNANNSLSINNAAPLVANWRQSIAGTPPAAPGGLTAGAVSASQIDLVWLDNSVNEVGFRVERSQDNANFLEIAAVGVDTTSYADTGLDSETTYFYRVKAYNGSGESGFSNTASDATPAPPAYVLQYPYAEQSIYGNVSGSYTNLFAVDGSVQQITEKSTGGKKKDRYTRLEHRWHFQVQPGNSISLTADVDTNAAGGESFEFAWSTNQSQWNPLFAVSQGNDGNKQAFLPAVLDGTVYIRVVDLQRQPGVQTGFSVDVDHLVIRTDNANGAPPEAPADLSASVTGPDSILLNWTDVANDELGYRVERSTDGGLTFILAGTTAANAGAFEDTGLAASSTFTYRVQAFNASGSSGYSNTASGTTQAAPNISLNANGYRVKGVKKVDLTWSGAGTPSVDIVRNGAVVNSTNNTGAFTDDLGKGGGGTFTYQVCESGTSICSGADTVVF